MKTRFLNKNSLALIFAIVLTIVVVILIKYQNQSMFSGIEKYHQKILECQNVIDRLEKDIRLLRKQTIRMTRLDEHLKKCQMIKRQQTGFSRVLHALLDHSPQELWLESFSANELKREIKIYKAGYKKASGSRKYYQLKITGRAISENCINLFCQSLKNEPLFKDVDIKLLRKDGSNWQFTIQSYFQ